MHFHDIMQEHLQYSIFNIATVFCVITQRVRTEEGLNLAEEFNIKFFETSAKENINVKECFMTLATDVKNRILQADGAVPDEFKVDVVRLTKGSGNKNGCPC